MSINLSEKWVPASVMTIVTSIIIVSAVIQKRSTAYRYKPTVINTIQDKDDENEDKQQQQQKSAPPLWPAPYIWEVDHDGINYEQEDDEKDHILINPACTMSFMSSHHSNKSNTTVLNIDTTYDDDSDSKILSFVAPISPIHDNCKILDLVMINSEQITSQQVVQKTNGHDHYDDDNDEDNEFAITFNSHLFSGLEDVYVDRITWFPDEFKLTAYVSYGIKDNIFEDGMLSDDDGDPRKLFHIYKEIFIQGFPDNNGISGNTTCLDNFSDSNSPRSRRGRSSNASGRNARTEDCTIHSDDTSDIVIQFRMLQYSQDLQKWSAVLTISKWKRK